MNTIRIFAFVASLLITGLLLGVITHSPAATAVNMHSTAE
jgi:hypothetical protein